MNVGEAIDWIHSLLPRGIKPGLERMSWMMERFGHPENGLKFIHIAGTNGKGSTTMFVASVLREAGYNVGMYTSPYLETFHDRIRWNGKFIADEDLVSLVKRIKPLVEELDASHWGSPTEFEVITAMAILYFAEMKQTDFVVWETGLGGRLDSTNIVTPLVSVITNVGYDHMNILGDQLSKIAREKAGIIKRGVPVVTGERKPEALDVIRESSEMMQSPLYRIDEDFQAKRLSFSEQHQEFSFSGPNGGYSPVHIRMMGMHQVTNAATGIMALEILRQKYGTAVTKEHILKGMASAFWPGRFERLLMGREMPTILFDGAHNPDGAISLAATLQELYPDKKITMLFAVLKDKNWEDILNPLLPLCQSVVVSEVDHPRKLEAERVFSGIRNWVPELPLTIAKDGCNALRELIDQGGPQDLILVTGSLYFISEIRNYCSGMLEEAGKKSEYV